MDAKRGGRCDASKLMCNFNRFIVQLCLCDPDQGLIDPLSIPQVSMLKDLDLEIPIGSDPTADILEALCWAVVRPVANAMRGCERKRVPTIAAFVNTLLVPQLFDKHQASDLICGYFLRNMTDLCAMTFPTKPIINPSPYKHMLYSDSQSAAHTLALGQESWM